ncbi:MAG TPA: hypothetical protein VG297_05510 [Bryobacteraceae bacterium]|nr:hypothetical protein [Bryobacteraceae bacterium]
MCIGQRESRDARAARPKPASGRNQCWDINSGRKIAQFGGFLGGVPAAASSHGSRLVFTSDLAFPGRNEALVFPHGDRIVWDFRSGADIAAWGAPQIAWARGAGSHTFDSVAISASGRYVAETTRTLFRIYELP